MNTNHLDLIVKNGTVKIPSIFLFKYFEDVTIFLDHAKKANCTVIFDNEDITIAPNHDDLGNLSTIQPYSAILSYREIGNAYVRFFLKIEDMSWDNTISE